MRLWPRPALSLGVVLLLSAVLRVLLIAYGEWQDAQLPVPYTDLDYGVYGDAARLLLRGHSPYRRPTFRYSPAIAALLTVNELSGVGSAGKLLFAAADLLLGWLVADCLRLRGLPAAARVRAACVSLLNPLSVTVSTRGNADVIVAVVCVAALHALLRRRSAACGLCLALAVHLKLYPAVFAPAFLACMDSEYTGRDGGGWLQRWLSRERLQFAAGLSCGLCLLSGLSLALYGDQFLQQAVLHHVTRLDTRHNFSLYFYHLYLSSGLQASLLQSVSGFLPQLGVLLLLSGRTARDLPLCLFLQCALFVMLNKVVTAQYFLWFFSLLPLLLPYSRLTARRLAAMAALWLAAELHWLLWAAALELQGRAVFLALHAAAAAFFLLQLALLSALVAGQHSTPTFSGGRVRQWEDKER